MKIIAEPLPGAYLLEPRVSADTRGVFVKTFHLDIFAELGIRFQPAEEFFSVSQKNVLRGMHFHLPPHEHAKLVYCIRGRVLDILVDLRTTLGTFGRAISAELDAESHHQFYVPKGVAHGFLSLEDNSTMVYKTSTVFAPSHDAGIRWDSFGFIWPVSSPIVSPRDAALTPLATFASPW